MFEVYPAFEEDLRDSLEFINEDSLKFIPKEVAEKIDVKEFDVKQNAEHKKITGEIISALKRNESHHLPEKITRAAWIRRFLG